MLYTGNFFNTNYSLATTRMIINMYDKKLFCIRYIYNNMNILKVFETNLDIWNVKINKQANKIL